MSHSLGAAARRPDRDHVPPAPRPRRSPWRQVGVRLAHAIDRWYGPALAVLLLAAVIVGVWRWQEATWAAADAQPVPPAVPPGYVLAGEWPDGGYSLYDCGHMALIYYSPEHHVEFALGNVLPTEREHDICIASGWGLGR